MKKILHIVGNRPHFIKLAVLHRQLASDKNILQEIIHTGQHSSEAMSGVFFQELNIPRAQYSLNIDNTQGAEIFIANTSIALQKLFKDKKDTIVFTYGDTNTTLAAAIAAKRTGLQLHHFEGGIRTGDFTMAEELNRVITDRFANVNYCCTRLNYDTLLSEVQVPARVFLTGDLMYDAFLKTKPADAGIAEKEYVACTIHRAAAITNREYLLEIINALNVIHKQIPVLLPVHPHTKKMISAFGIKPAFTLLPPFSYRQMKGFLQRSSYIITDSGGVSREAYFSHKKSLVISPVLFWPEIANAGCAINAFGRCEEIIEGFEKMKALQCNFNTNIFGDGNAAEKIHSALMQ